jgi:ribosome-binding protein aMBF1 (putative translation factor)
VADLSGIDRLNGKNGYGRRRRVDGDAGYDKNHVMKPDAPKTVTDRMRQAISDSGLPMLTMANETGIQRASLIRFARGDQNLRLDLADRLAVYFGLALVAEKEQVRKGGR